jgi:predicted metal-dependent peptidase
MTLAAERVELERRALDALIASRAELGSTHPQLASLALRLDLVPVWDSRCPTASTNSRAIYFRPDYVLSLSDYERTLLFLHEVLHCALGHFQRDVTGDPHEWNIAFDQEVNDILAREGLTPPPTWIHFQNAAGMSAEAVYSNLDKLMPRAQRDGAQQQHNDVHPNEWERRAADESQRETDPRMSVRVDLDAQHAWDALTAVMVMQSRSTDPYSPLLARLGELHRKANLNWRAILERFLSRGGAGSSRWLPPARRYVHRGLYMPSRREGTLRVVFVADVSGSTAEYLQQFAHELEALVRTFDSYELWLVTCDDEIQSAMRYDAETPLDLTTISFRSGGWTSLEPPFEWVERERLEADVLVYLTDGLGQAPLTPPAIPTLWVLPPGYQAPAPWGESAQLD